MNTFLQNAEVFFERYRRGILTGHEWVHSLIRLAAENMPTDLSRQIPKEILEEIRDHATKPPRTVDDVPRTYRIETFFFGRRLCRSQSHEIFTNGQLGTKEYGTGIDPLFAYKTEQGRCLQQDNLT